MKLDDVFGEDSEYDVGRQLAKEFVEKTGLVTLPQVRGQRCYIKIRNH